MKRGLLFFTLASSLCLTGCSKDGYEDAREDTKPLVDAACGWMFACCSTDELSYQLGDFTVNAGNCSERLLDAISTGVPLELEQDLSDDPAEALLILALSINEGRVEVDEDAVSACAAATSTMACNMVESIDPNTSCTPEDQIPPDPCDPEDMFVGVQELGEPCDGPWECAAGLRCVDFGLAGVCAQRSAAGEFCFADNECADALVCDWQTGTCSAGAPLGQTCAFTDPANPVPGTESIRCAEGLSCDPVGLTCVGGYCSPGANCGDIFNDSDCPEGYLCVGNFATAPTCQQPGDAGSPCSKPEDCSTGACDLNTETCIELLADGTPCGFNDECSSGFCSVGLCSPSAANGQPCPSLDPSECGDGYCDSISDPLNPVCAAYASEGGACPNGNECDPEAMLSCVDGTCLMPPFADGTTCFDSSQCESQVCFMGVCSAGLPAGSSCTTDGTGEPCELGAFCETADGSFDGTCAALRRSGESCLNDNQCWGSCVVRFGEQMCDATPAFALDELWCDGV